MKILAYEITGKSEPPFTAAVGIVAEGRKAISGRATTIVLSIFAASTTWVTTVALRTMSFVTSVVKSLRLLATVGKNKDLSHV